MLPDNMLPTGSSHNQMPLKSVRLNCVHKNNNECYRNQQPNQQPQQQRRPLNTQKTESHLKSFKHNYTKRKKTTAKQQSQATLLLNLHVKMSAGIMLLHELRYFFPLIV